LALSDVLFFTNPLEIRPTAPAESHLVFPGELRLLSSVRVGELAAYRTRAACAAFAAASPGAFGNDSFGALRLVTRALLAAGVPSMLYGTGVERVPGGGADYWQPFLSIVREGAAAAAHRSASAALEPRYRPAFRLYGFAGMNDREYEEYSKLEFSDTARSATTHLAAGRFQSAAAAFLELAQMARARQFESTSERGRLLAQIEQHLVRCFHELRDYDRAVAQQQKMIAHLAEFEGTPGPLSAVAYQSLGALLTQAERFEEATDAYGRCIELLREHGEAGDVAKVLGELGKSLDRAAEYERALGTFQEALEVYRELQRPAGVAKQHQRIGAIYLKRLNSAPRAEEHFLEARRLHQEAGEQTEAIESTVDIGLCRRALGDLDGALKLFTQASGRAADGGLRQVGARALSEIGNTRWLRGEYQAALELVGRSNQIAQDLDAPFRLNVNYQLLGLIYWELNEFDRALRALDAAIEAAGRAQAPLEMASAYNNRGIVYRRRREYAGALESFEQALEIDARLRSRWGQAYDHRNIGMTLHRMGRHDEASLHIEQAVSLSRAIQDRVNLAKALLARGELRLDQGRAGESETSLREALQMSRDVYLPEVEWRALRALGRLRRERGDEAGALQALQQGIEVVERLRGTIKVEEFQSGFLTNKMDLYEDAVGLLLDMGRAEEALSYAERSRARKFIDILAGQTFELRTDREHELYARQADLSRRARALRETLAREQDPESRAALGRQLDELQRDYSDALVDIRVANPALSSFVTVAVAEPKQLARMLPAEVAVVVYYLMSEEVAIWILHGGALEVRRVDVSRHELTARIRDYRLMVQNRELLDEVRRASLELYDLLVAPVGDLLEGDAVVGIVPHRALHYLSFASLYDGEAFLVERRALFYAPSASALKRTLEGELAPAVGELQVLAVGNPTVGDPAYELPFTEREVASIRRDFVNVVTLTGERATEDWVKENIGRFDVVHIGAHGRFDSVNPLFSSLMLARQEDDGL
ncbi:MAG: tetratricopeptide repeat protein, partial [Planctomycetota bacterium]